jgi:hypothetical protein
MPDNSDHGGSSVEDIYGADCPSCGRRIPYHLVDLRRPFQCQFCDSSVRVPASYLWFRTVLDLTALAGIEYLAGIRGVAFLIVLVVAFFPVSVILAIVIQRVMPARLINVERDIRSILHEHNHKTDGDES